MEFEVDPVAGWVFGAERVYSPNFDSRPTGVSKMGSNVVVESAVTVPEIEFVTNSALPSGESAKPLGS